MPDIFLIAHRAEITSLAARYRLPAVFPYRYFPALGGLQSYGNGCYAQAQARLLSVSAILVIASSAASKAKVDHERNGDDAGADEQYRFDHAQMIGVAAHSQQVCDHEHRIWDNQPSGELT